MICYVLAMGKQHLGPHVVVGYGIKIFWPSLFITSPDHLEKLNIPLRKAALFTMVKRFLCFIKLIDIYRLARRKSKRVL